MNSALDWLGMFPAANFWSGAALALAAFVLADLLKGAEIDRSAIPIYNDTRARPVSGYKKGPLRQI